MRQTFYVGLQLVTESDTRLTNPEVANHVAAAAEAIGGTVSDIHVCETVRADGSLSKEDLGKLILGE